MGLYINKFWVTLQKSYFGEMGKFVTDLVVYFYFLGRCPEFNFSIFIH